MVPTPKQRPSRLKAVGRSSGVDRSVMTIWAAGGMWGLSGADPLQTLCGPGHAHTLPPEPDLSHRPRPHHVLPFDLPPLLRPLWPRPPISSSQVQTKSPLGREVTAPPPPVQATPHVNSSPLLSRPALRPGSLDRPPVPLPSPPAGLEAPCLVLLGIVCMSAAGRREAKSKATLGRAGLQEAARSR